MANLLSTTVNGQLNTGNVIDLGYTVNGSISTTDFRGINFHAFSDYQYLIGKRAGAWTQPLDITFYTGIRYHAHQAYGGHKFYTGGFDSNFAFSIGDGDANVRIANTLIFSSSNSTMISNASMTDAIGYNTSYGTYIGSTVGGTYYIYGNGRFYDNGTIRTLIHSGNIGSQNVNSASYSNYVIDSSSVRITSPVSAFSVNNGYPSGAIRINLPRAVYNNNTMMSMTVDVYEYSTGQSFTLRIGGYNYLDGGWYNVFASLINDSGQNNNIPVYFGNNGSDRNVIWIGEPNWGFAYPNVFVRDFQAGHSQNSGWASDWSISFDPNPRTNVGASRIAYKQIDAGNISSQSVSYATSAGTLSSGATVSTLNAAAGTSFVAQGYNNNGGFAMNNASTYWGLMWNYGSNDWRLGRGSQIAQNGWNLRWDASDNVYTNGTLNANYFRNGSVWINNGADYNDYNENIRLFNAPNGVSVIAFSASGTGGTPITSLLGFSDRLETRVSGTWEQRIYGGYVEARGSFRAPIFYDSADTSYYGDFAGFSRMSEIGVTNDYVYNYDSIDSSRAVAEFGNVGKYVAKRSGAADYPSFSFEHTFGNHSWGQIARFHIGGSGGADRPSIQFSSAQSNDRWNIGFCTGTDNNFRISQNMGYRPDNSGTTDGWGTERFRINTDGTAYLPSTLSTNEISHANGRVSLTGNLHIDSYNGNDIYMNYYSSRGTRIYVGSGTLALHVNTDGLVYMPTVVVNSHSDNLKGYRIHNTSSTSVSAMFVNSSNQLVIAAGAVDQINLNKKVYVLGGSIGVNVTPSTTPGRIDASNDIVAFSSSDERLKENITPIANALDKVKLLTGVEFDWKPEYKGAHGHEGHDTGIIAQEVQDVMPSAVRTNETGFLAVRYEKLIGLLIEANKELAARVEKLENKL